MDVCILTAIPFTVSSPEPIIHALQNLVLIKETFENADASLL
jgi:hypothetical protein